MRKMVSNKDDPWMKNRYNEETPSLYDSMVLTISNTADIIWN